MTNAKTQNAQAKTAATDAATDGVWGTNHSLFLGEYSHKVDGKGRLALPAKFRPALSKGAIVTRGMDGCLYLFSLEQWKPLADKLAKLPLYSKPEARTLQREVLAGATAVTPDRQGRILLPPHLREYGGFDSETGQSAATPVVVAGLYNRVEIWPADAWQKRRGEVDLDQAAEKLADLGI